MLASLQSLPVSRQQRANTEDSGAVAKLISFSFFVPVRCNGKRRITE